MLLSEKIAQQKTLAAVRASFNADIAVPVNVAGASLQANATAHASPELTSVIGAFNATVRALNASGQTLLAAIAATDAIVPTDPVPVPVPVPTTLGATNQRTGVVYPGIGGPTAAMTTAASGDTILVNPGVYSMAVTLRQTLTIKSAVPGQKYVFDGGGNAQARVIELGIGVGLTIEDAWIRNNKGQWSNAGGIWPGGGTYALTVKRCIFSDLNNGIIIGQHPDATVLIEDSEAYDNGDYVGQTHNFYIGTVGLLTFRRNYVHAVRQRGDPGVQDWTISWGHLLKSRAKKSLIEDNRLFMGRGEANRCIDLPNGGDVVIRRNMLEYRTPQNKGAGQFISYGVEEGPGGFAANHPVHSLVIEDNVAVNRAGVLADFLWIANTLPTTYIVKGNLFAGPHMPSVKGDPKWAIDTTTNKVVPITALKDADGYDWTLLPEPWRPQSAAPVGFLDGITPDGVISGWSYDPDAKTVANAVHVYIDGQAGTGTLISIALTDVFRADVDTAYGLTGNHGYGVPIPSKFRDGMAHSVYVYGISATDPNVSFLLRNCPGTFTIGGVVAPPAPPDPIRAPWVPVRDTSGKITNFSALPDRTWMPVPGTAMEATIKPLLDAGGYTLYRYGDSKLGAVMDNYSGMAWDYTGGIGWAYGGGHHGGSDNGIYQIDLNSMRWSIYSYPSHPVKDFTPEQLAYYTGGARRGGMGGEPVHIYPLAESSTGFAIKADQAFSSTRWFAVPGPERDASLLTAVFANGDTWAQAGSHQMEYTFGGNQNFSLFDGRPVSMHTYNGFVASGGRPVLITRSYWGSDATGWLRYPNTGAGVHPMKSSGENVWVQSDEETGLVWWGGCASNCWADNYYFYKYGIIFDPVTFADAPTPRLTPDNDVVGSSMVVNAGDLMTFSFKAGRRIGGLCSRGYGWTYDLDTGARQLLFLGGDVYSGNIGEGRSLTYIPHLGQTWIFDTSVPSCPVWSVDVDHPQIGGPAGSLLVDCQRVALANAAALPSSRNGLVYSRLTFWESEKLLVYFPTTIDDCWVCRLS